MGVPVIGNDTHTPMAWRAHQHKREMVAASGTRAEQQNLWLVPFSSLGVCISLFRCDPEEQDDADKPPCSQWVLLACLRVHLCRELTGLTSELHYESTAQPGTSYLTRNHQYQVHTP